MIDFRRIFMIFDRIFFSVEIWDFFSSVIFLRFRSGKIEFGFSGKIFFRIENFPTSKKYFSAKNAPFVKKNHTLGWNHELNPIKNTSFNISLLCEPTDTLKQKFTVQKTTLFENNSTFFIIKMKHFSIDHNSSSVHSWQIMFLENPPRRPITLRICKEMRLCMKSLMKPGYTGNHDYGDGMAIVFWLIRRWEIVVLITLTCSIWCLTMRKRFYTKFHF